MGEYEEGTRRIVYNSMKDPRVEQYEEGSKMGEYVEGTRKIKIKEGAYYGRI